MIYEDKNGNFLGEDEVNSLDVSKIVELGIHAFEEEDVIAGLRG